MTNPDRAREPRTAVVWAVLDAELRRSGRPLAVVDVGGGTGGFAVPLARLGHTVTVVDPSPDALATLARRAVAGGVAERIRAVQGDSDTLADVVPAGSADLVLCHSLLEIVDDPGQALDVVTTMLAPGAALSVLVANRAAAVLARALSGQFAEAVRTCEDPDGRSGRGDGAARRFDPATITGLLTAVGLTVEDVHGVRVVSDLVPGQLLDGDTAGLVALEHALAAVPPYRDIATQIHVLARR